MILLYGATGYTGELILEEARRQKINLVMAGRDASKLGRLKEKYQFEFRTFDCKNKNDITPHLDGITAVLHCAGPFVETYKAMAAACIAKGVHYLDITGEIPVYEGLHAMSEEAKSAGVTLLPGVGFDIVPTDCMARALKEAMPNATKLQMGFTGMGGVSPGTTKSSLAQLPGGSKIRVNGEMKKIPFFSLEKQVDIRGKPTKFYAIPWGDVYTAYISTGIPNIEVYTAFDEKMASAGKFAMPLAGMLKSNTILKGFQALVDLTVKGPDQNTRDAGRALVWGEVTNAKGESVKKRLETCEAYKFTALSALKAAQLLLKEGAPAGFLTPSLAFGSDFVLKIAGSKFVE